MRGLASLALDGELDDDVGRALLSAHLATCRDCARRVADQRATAQLLRRAPLEQLHLTLPRRCLARAGRRARRGHWSTIAAAGLALVIGASPFALVAGAGRDAGMGAGPRSSAPPPRLPLGQRSAGDDFASAGAPVLGLR